MVKEAQTSILDWEEETGKKLDLFNDEFEKAAVNCGRDRAKIEVLFATKYISGEKLAVFISLINKKKKAAAIIGENRVQEAFMKFGYLSSLGAGFDGKYTPVMIGTSQKNKINKALSIFDEIHSLDNLATAEAVNYRAVKVVPIYLQVNVSGEKTKQGIIPDQAGEVIEKIRKMDNLNLKGLMTMAPYSDNPEDVRPHFGRLKQLAQKYDLLTSMGMSNDWKEAISEGSDMIRIGSAIFK